MSNITLDEMGPLLTREASARTGTLLSIFCLISLVFLVIGFFWQKKYTSEVQIYVDDSNIVAPIIGTEQVATRDKANVAKEELFAIDILDRILDQVGFTNADTTPADREEAREDLIDNTSVSNQNNQLLQIDYYHDQPEVAFKVTSLYADLFLQKTMDSSTEETTEAFEFIINQVETYRNKLEDAEGRLESFRSQHTSWAKPGSRCHVFRPKLTCSACRIQTTTLTLSGCDNKLKTSSLLPSAAVIR